MLKCLSLQKTISFQFTSGIAHHKYKILLTNKLEGPFSASATGSKDKQTSNIVKAENVKNQTEI